MTASESTKRWKQTPSGQAATARYETSEKGRATRRRAQIAWKARNHEYIRWHARIMARVYHAVRRGDLIRFPCAKCGTSPAQAHHHKGYDDAHILDVLWLCARHHTEAHGRGIDR